MITGFLLSCLGCLVTGFAACLLAMPRIVEWAENDPEAERRRLLKKLGIATCETNRKR